MNPSKNGWLRKFLSIPGVQTDKPPLKPRQAVVISIITIIITLIIAAWAYLFFSAPLTPTIFCSAVVLYIFLGVSWCSIDWKTKNIVMRGHTIFEIWAVSVLILAIIFGEEKKPFPGWGISLLIIGAIVGYSNVGVYAVLNFIKWLKGGFSEPSKNKDD